MLDLYWNVRWCVSRSSPVTRMFLTLCCRSYFEFPYASRPVGVVLHIAFPPGVDEENSFDTYFTQVGSVAS